MGGRLLHLLHARRTDTIRRSGRVSNYQTCSLDSCFISNCSIFGFSIDTLILVMSLCSMNVINEQIKEAKFIKNRVRYRTLSAKARDLIEGLINKDAAKRLNI